MPAPQAALRHDVERLRGGGIALERRRACDLLKGSADETTSFERSVYATKVAAMFARLRSELWLAQDPADAALNGLLDRFRLGGLSLGLSVRGSGLVSE